ncbi:MAG: hypothetical protein KFB93_02050 [Simkaniaceae bacterium]|nr:MAG: hypothetical protein KFB93_02050 [Simkaniaceae bacterium]
MLIIVYITSIAVIFISTLSYLGYKNSGLILAQIISRTTHTPVTINTIDFHQEAFTIQNLIIANPDNAYIPTAFKAEVVKVNSSYKEYFKNHIKIDKIEMDNVYINIEFYTEDKLEGNWQSLIENMGTSHHLSYGNKHKTFIKKLVLNNVQITLVLSDGKIHRLSPIPHLEFDDVTSEEGFPIKEISEIIARKMLYSILREERLNLIIKIPITVIKKILPFL